MSKIVKLLERSAELQLSLSAIGILGILLAIFADVFLRAAFNAPISATLEIVSFWCMIPVTFFPLMYLEYRREHIDTDLFYSMFPIRQKHLSDLVSGFIAVLLYSLLAWLTFNQAITATKAQEVSMGVNLIPIWPVRWVLPVAFGTAAVAAMVLSIRDLTTERDDG